MSNMIRVMFSVVVTIVYYIALMPLHDVVHELAHAWVAHKYGAKACVVVPIQGKERNYRLGGVEIFLIHTATFRKRFGRGLGGLAISDATDEKVQRKITLAGPISDFSYLFAAFLADILILLLIHDSLLRIDMFIMISVAGIVMAMPNWIGKKREIEEAYKKVAEAPAGTEVDIVYSDGTKIWYRDEISRIDRLIQEKNLVSNPYAYETILRWINEDVPLIKKTGHV